MVEVTFGFWESQNDLYTVKVTVLIPKSKSDFYMIEVTSGFWKSKSDSYNVAIDFWIFVIQQ